MSQRLSPPPKAPKPAKKMAIPKGYHLIFRPWRKDPQSGRILYAAAYGLKAWPILVQE
jgi:hypothetical protein